MVGHGRSWATMARHIKVVASACVEDGSAEDRGWIKRQFVEDKVWIGRRERGGYGLSGTWRRDGNEQPHLMTRRPVGATA